MSSARNSGLYYSWFSHKKFTTTLHTIPMKKVELVFERTCPNVDMAREQLREAFTRIQQAPYWQEWEVSEKSAPDYIRAYGSPTILVDERDVSGSGPEGKDCCRVYKGEDGHLNIVPKLEDIIRALKSSP
jgi:mercuric ion transport protein